jgi:hypothetical protein
VNNDLRPPGPLAPGALRVTALGGVGEIGRNMTVFEHLGRLLIVDCGVLFPGHDEPGVDLILPDLRHIEDRLEDIEAPKHYKLVAAGKGSNGVVDAVGTVDLETLADGTTQLNYGGEAQIGGMLASVGQRLIEGAARQLIGQAVKALEAQILQRMPADTQSAPAGSVTDQSVGVAQAAPSDAEPVRKSVVLSESEQLKPETLISGMINEWLATTTGKVIVVVVLLFIGFLLGRMR